MKQRGFTLIELLAVIVILAIIALIITPVVLGIINDSKIQSRKKSIELYKRAIQTAVSSYMITNDGDLPTIDWIKNNVESFYEGNEVTCEQINLDIYGNVTLNGCNVIKK